jgi:transposase
MIQAPKTELQIMRYELSDYEWSVIRPMLPNKPRGIPRVDDRRILNGIFWVLRSGRTTARSARQLWSSYDLL